MPLSLSHSLAHCQSRAPLPLARHAMPPLGFTVHAGLRLILGREKNNQGK